MEAPQEEATSESSAKKKGRSVVITTEDMQKSRKDDKARTTLLLALSDEHQLRFSKYETAKELWEVKLKTFGGNEATKKTKNNQLKQQYGNFKARVSETLEQTFNRLQAIRNRDDLDTMSLDDVYNPLKVYEPKVQKKLESNYQNMAFISSANTSSGKAASISHDTNMALLSMGDDRFWKKTGKKITIQGTNVAGFDKSKVECFNYHKIGHFARECRAPRSQEMGKRESYKQGSKEEEPAPKALMAIDGIGWDWSYMANEEENHALVADDEAPTEFALMAKSNSSSKNEVKDRLVEFKTQEIKFCEKIRGLEIDVEFKNNKIEYLMNELKQVKKEKKGLDSKLIGFESISKDLDTLLRSQRTNKNKEGLGYSVVPPPTQVYSPPKKDINSFVSEHGESSSSIMSKPMIKFVKAADSLTVIKTNKVKTARKSSVKYTEMYRNTLKSPKVRGKTWPKNNSAHKNVTPRADLLKTGRTPIAVNRTNMNVAQPKRTSFAKTTHSYGNSQNNIDDKGYWDSGCSQHMTGNITYLSEYEPYDEGDVSFGQEGGKITGKGIIKTGKLEFENVYFVKDLKYNLFSVSQICDNKNSVLFTDSECIVLGKDFKLKDDTNVFLRTPSPHNMYSINLNDIVPHKNLTCLVVKASVDESMLWHKRLGHLNFKTMNKLVRHNLFKCLPSKCYENDHTCVACLKGKQQKASCKTQLVNYVAKPLHTLHMDLFRPTSICSLNHKWYCLVVTDDFSRFTWTFFLRTKDETSGILRNFITEIENLNDLKVKIIRNRTLIKAARTMLADAKLLVTFWVEVVNTACYVQNSVLVNKSQNKTPYELFNNRTLAIGFLRPFGCHVMIFNTLDHLGKFDAKGDKGYFVGYSMSSKAFRVFNKRTKKVEENLHVDFLENKLIEKGASLNWLFDINTLTNSMNYVPVDVAGTSSTNISVMLKMLAMLSRISNPIATSKIPPADQMETLTVESKIPTVSSPIATACLDNSLETSGDTRLISKGVTSQEETPSLDNILTLSNRFEDILGDTTNTVDTNRVEADLRNMETSITASPTPTFRIHKDHSKSQIISPVDTPIQTRHKSEEMEEHSFIATIHQKTNPDLLQFFLFSCFLSQEEPKKIFKALKDPSWAEAMQAELLQFKI
nr:hypothetical protein [Tanacetum cinerariifolium]